MGYTALLDGAAYQDTAEALEISQVSSISKEAFETLMNSSPERCQRIFYRDGFGSTNGTTSANMQALKSNCCLAEGHDFLYLVQSRFIQRLVYEILYAAVS